MNSKGNLLTQVDDFPRRIAIVHDALMVAGGAERLTVYLSQTFRRPIFTPLPTCPRRPILISNPKDPYITWRPDRKERTSIQTTFPAMVLRFPRAGLITIRSCDFLLYISRKIHSPPKKWETHMLSA
jgi:hypothetical protein